jgi:hypothetical protein
MYRLFTTNVNAMIEKRDSIYINLFVSGTLLLLQCFWKYLADLVAKAKFMTSKEFKFYIFMFVKSDDTI